jgi:hypothetical protein
MENQLTQGAFKRITEEISPYNEITSYYLVKKMQDINLLKNLLEEISWINFCISHNIPTIEAPEVGGISAIFDEDKMYVANQATNFPSDQRDRAIICSHFNDSLGSWLKIQDWLQKANSKDKKLFNEILGTKIQDIRHRANQVNIALTFDAYAVIFNSNLAIDQNNPKLSVMDFDLVRLVTKNFWIMVAYNYINAVFYKYILVNPLIRNLRQSTKNSKQSRKLIANVITFLINKTFTNSAKI